MDRVCQGCRKAFILNTQRTTICDAVARVTSPSDPNAVLPAMPTPHFAARSVPEGAAMDHAQIVHCNDVLMLHAADVCGIDFPLCLECARKRVEDMHKKLRELAEEAAYVESFVGATPDLVALVSDPNECAEETEEIDELNAMESALLDELEQVDVAADDILQQEERLAEEEDELKRMSNAVSAELNCVLSEEMLLRDRDEGMKVQIDEQKRQAARLQTLAVLTECYQVDVSGAIATVNGNRIGNGAPPTEINLACGYMCHVAQLLATLHSIKLRYKLFPNGTGSTIQVITPKPKTLEFYVSNRLLFAWKFFAPAMSAFAHCVEDITRHFRSVFPDSEPPPFSFDGDDKVGGASVVSSDAQWTKAMKNLLGNLEWCMVRDVEWAEGRRRIDAPESPPHSPQAAQAT